MKQILVRKIAYALKVPRSKEKDNSSTNIGEDVFQVLLLSILKIFMNA